MTAPGISRVYMPFKKHDREFPSELTGRHSPRVGGMLVEEQAYESGGVHMHFWAYPFTPASRMTQALTECKRSKDLLSWNWSIIPAEHLPAVLHAHTRDLLLRGSKEINQAYAFAPDVVLQYCEIFDVYRELWPGHARSPRRHEDIFHYAREVAEDYRAVLNRVLSDVRCDSKLRGVAASDHETPVDLEVRDLRFLLMISGDVLHEESGERVSTADGRYPIFGQEDAASKAT